MAAFTEINWQRFDHYAIVENQGLATIEESRRTACREWLEAHGYQIHSIDCSGGYTTAAPEFGRAEARRQKIQSGSEIAPREDRAKDQVCLRLAMGGGGIDRRLTRSL